MVGPRRVTHNYLLTLLEKSFLPVVSRYRDALCWTALVLGGLALVTATVGLVQGGPILDGDRWASGPLTPLAAAPLFLAAHVFALRRRVHAGTILLFGALHTASLLAGVPAGPGAGVWLAQPLLAVMTTTCLGVLPGGAMVAAGVFGAAYVFVWREGPGGAVAPWLLGGMVVGAAFGVLVHRVLLGTIESERLQRDSIRDSRRALRHRERLLRHALRVETVGALASLVVHSLRNQFQVVMSHAALATREDEQQRADRLQRIRESLHEARPLLDQLMDLAHPDDGRAHYGDLNDHVRVFLENLRRVLPASLELEYELHDGPLPVLLDPRGLEHALWNLVINARQAMDSHGTLRLSTGDGDAEAWIAVRDSGSGIPPDQLDRIFEPYFTTKRMGEGTGLGLTAVSRFVQGSQGRVDVESVVDEGACFTLVFPMTSQDHGQVG